MTKQRLKIEYISAIFEKVSGKTVAKAVNRVFCWDFGTIYHHIAVDITGIADTNASIDEYNDREEGPMCRSPGALYKSISSLPAQKHVPENSPNHYQ